MIRRTLDFLFNAAGYLAAFFIFAIFCVMIGQTVMREMGLSTRGYEDLVSWFTAASAFLGLAYAFRNGDFVRVTLLIERLEGTGRRVMEAVTLSIATVFTGYLAYWAIRYVHESWKFKEVSQNVIVVPVWIPQLSFVVGAVLLFIAVVDQLVEVLRGRKPIYVVATEERHARGDYSGDL